MDDAESIESVAVLLYEGFEELDAVGPYEVFGVAANRAGGIEVSTVARERTDRVTGEHGLGVEPDAALPAVDPDLIVVPGGGWIDPGAVGARALVEEGSLPRILERLHEEGVLLAGVCTGGMLLAAAGVLDGRPAVTHASAIDDLAAYADPVDSRVVDAGDVLTAGGVTAGIDLALWVVAERYGEELAAEVSSVLEHDRSRDVHVA